MFILKNLEQLLGLQKAFDTTISTNDGGAALTEFLGVEVTYDIDDYYEFTVNGEKYFLDDTIVDHLLSLIGWEVKDVVLKAFELAEQDLEDYRAKRLITLIWGYDIPQAKDDVKFSRKDNQVRLSNWMDGPRGTLEDVLSEYF